MILTISSSAFAADMERIVKNVEKVCLKPSEAGKHWKVIQTGKAGANAPFRIVNIDINAEATFTKGEWQGVQQVLKQHQSAENASYRNCVVQLKELFKEKFAPGDPAGKYASSKETNSNQTKKVKTAPAKENKAPVVLPSRNQQETHGNYSPAINANGNVTVNYGSSKEDIDEIFERFRKQLQANTELIKSLTKAITDLSQGKGVSGSESQIKAAIESLKKGDTRQAKALFVQETQRVELAAKQGAEAYRNLGALAYLDNTQEALQAYTRATQLDPDNADGWNNLGILLHRVGDLDEAIAAYNKVLTIGEIDQNKVYIATAYGNIGNVYQTRGDMDKTIEFYQKALKLDEELGSKEGMAAAYGNLGSVYQTRGELDKAIEFHQKALKLNEGLGSKKVMADNYGNLGNVYQTRGELDKAIEFHQKALKLNEELGSKNGMADNYINLGIVCQTRGELDKVIEFNQRALKLNEELGRKQGMAANYGNLGNVYQTLGKLDNANEFYLKALKLNEGLGSKEGMAANYGNVGNVYQTLGELDRAIEFYQKALKFNEELGSKEGMAENYANFGSAYRLKGSRTEAKRYYLMSIKLFEQMSSPNAKTVQTLLDNITVEN